jgi:CRISPR-associated protein Cmr6
MSPTNRATDSLACRQDLLEAAHFDEPRPIAHAGLLLSRYLKYPVQTNPYLKARDELFNAVCGPALIHAKPLYKPAFERRVAWFERYEYTRATLASHLLTQSIALPITGRMIVGLGNASPLEVSIQLEHTYGVPIIPGSALKGLAAHFCDQVWSQENQEFAKSVEDEKDGQPIQRTGKLYQTLFGDTDASGYITFYDAWIQPEHLDQKDSGLLWDVMTPHHSAYYSAKTYQNGPNAGHRIAPSDFDDPNPIAFLSVSGTFHLGISCSLPDSSESQLTRTKQWLALSLELLQQALAHWGIGGKTSSGYGRLHKVHERPSETAQTKAAASLQSGDVIQAKLLVEKTRRGGWMALHSDTNAKGPINNSGDVPEHYQPDDEITLEVASVGSRGQLQFRYPMS